MFTTWWEDSIQVLSKGGLWWYGIHITDKAGNWSTEPNPPGPIEIVLFDEQKIVQEVILDIGMPYSEDRGCGNFYYYPNGCGGPYHGFYMGVCTDLVTDGYNAALDMGAKLFNLSDDFERDAVEHPERYQYRTIRWSPDMYYYFRYNQQILSHDTPYMPGDIAFFNLRGGRIDHVSIVSEVDKNGRPLRMIHATGLSIYYPTGLALEENWNAHSDYESHVIGHGRLISFFDNSLNLTNYQQENSKTLSITLESSDVKLRLIDNNGRWEDGVYNNDLFGFNDSEFLPYIPGCEYDKSSLRETISIYLGQNDTDRFFAEITAREDTTYTLTIQARDGSEEIFFHSFTEDIKKGEVQVVRIDLNRTGPISFMVKDPIAIPAIEIPEEIRLLGITGGSASATLEISEKNGEMPLINANVSIMALLPHLGPGLPDSQVQIIPENFELLAGSKRHIDIQIDLQGVNPGLYLSSLLIRSDDSVTYRVRIMLIVRDINGVGRMFLPLVTKSE